ncbi:MAG: YggT family protein [Pseudonocardiales bacterium]|nr:YggT family protein [Pseudonocardiales bacterium]MBV9030216.1 YggT family protein [Pseudonocardiales bacterium]
MGALLALVALALLLFELLLIARIVLDLVSVLARPGYDERLEPVRQVVYRLTEPVLAPVRRVVRPVRMGGVSFDLAVTLVFVTVVVLRQLVA